MLELPSRDALSAFTRAVDAVLPTTIVGLARAIDDVRVQMLFWHAHGVGSYIVSIEDVPDVLRPMTDGVGKAAVADCIPESAVQWRATLAGARQILSVPVPDLAPVTRLWVGLADTTPATADHIHGLTAVAAHGGIPLGRPLSAADQASRLERLELASGLLPALMQVLDIREVLDSLSEISKRALPHDILTLSLLNDDLTRVTMQARSGAAARRHVPPIAWRRSRC